jgi:hypothetical protein
MDGSSTVVLEKDPETVRFKRWLLGLQKPVGRSWLE